MATIPLRSIFIGEHRGHARSPGTYRLAVKDNIDVHGTVTTMGSAVFAEESPADSSAPVVMRLLNAPGVEFVGKTNLDEFAAGASGENTHFGPIPNPRFPHLPTGGSSGGAAAAVAAGMADISLGTDTGGSIRIPAALCGVLGLKPTVGAWSTHGLHPFSQFVDTVGPIADNLADLRFALEAIGAGDGAPVEGLPRVGRLRLEDEEPELTRAIDEWLASTGVDATCVELDGWEGSRETFYTITRRQFFLNYGWLLDEADRQVGETVRTSLRRGSAIDTAQYGKAVAEAKAWTIQVEALFEDVDVLVAPIFLDRYPAADSLTRENWRAVTVQFNLSGHPALAVPLQAPAGEFSVSVQLVGPLGADSRLLDIAEKLKLGS